MKIRSGSWVGSRMHVKHYHAGDKIIKIIKGMRFLNGDFFPICIRPRSRHLCVDDQVRKRRECAACFY